MEVKFKNDFLNLDLQIGNLYLLQSLNKDGFVIFNILNGDDIAKIFLCYEHQKISIFLGKRIVDYIVFSMENKREIIQKKEFLTFFNYNGIFYIMNEAFIGNNFIIDIL